MTTLLPFKNNTSFLIVLSVTNWVHHFYPPQNSTEEHCLKYSLQGRRAQTGASEAHIFKHHLNTTPKQYPEQTAKSEDASLENRDSLGSLPIVQREKTAITFWGWPVCLSESITGGYQTCKSELNYRKTRLSPKSFSRAMSVCQI